MTLTWGNLKLSKNKFSKSCLFVFVQVMSVYESSKKKNARS